MLRCETKPGLPDCCLAVLPSDETQIVKIVRGERGYYPLVASVSQVWAGKTVAEKVDKMNEALAVTPAQREAMITGSMFGWDNLAADPARYAADGTPLPATA